MLTKQNSDNSSDTIGPVRRGFDERVILNSARTLRTLEVEMRTIQKNTTAALAEVERLTKRLDKITERCAAKFKELEDKWESIQKQ